MLPGTGLPARERTPGANYNNARSLICRIDRDELLQELVRSYLEKD